MGNQVNFTIYLITDRKQLAAEQTLLSATEAALRGGIRAVQLREKDLTAADLLPLALEMRSLTNDYAALLMINDRVDVALACRADGVHLGGHSLPVDAARSLLGPDRLVGVSTHSRCEIERAATLGADFATFGPVYPTRSKAAFGPAKGLDALRAACLDPPLPVFALGGIKPDNQLEVLQAGASGIALISAILSDPDPQTAAARFRLS
jgi:thiamine-phosphate pyrophosphorylase